jgi:hypothetical protein
VSFGDFHAIAQKHRHILQAHSLFKQADREAVAEHMRVEFDARDFTQARERPLPIRNA